MENEEIEFERRRFPKLVITEKEIHGSYKGRDFNIFLIEKGNVYFREGEKRYNIDVLDLKCGMYDVNTWEECKDIKEALYYAVTSALL